MRFCHITLVVASPGGYEDHVEYIFTRGSFAKESDFGGESHFSPSLGLHVCLNSVK